MIKLQIKNIKNKKSKYIYFKNHTMSCKLNNKHLVKLNFRFYLHYHIALRWIGNHGTEKAKIATNQFLKTIVCTS